MQLSKNLRIESSITPTAGAAGTTAINGSTIDTKGYESVLWIVRFGAMTTGAVTSIKLQHDDDSALGTVADVAGTSQSVAVADAQKTFYIGVTKPTKRYMRLVVSRGTANAVVASSHALLGGPGDAPVSHGSNVSGAAFVSPASGTA